MSDQMPENQDQDTEFGESIPYHPKRLVLSEGDSHIFFEALIYPPEPNEHLRRAFERAKHEVISSEFLQ